MKKKMIILLASMVLTLAACGNTETTNEPESMEVSVKSESGESIESVESSVAESSEEEFSEEESADLSAYVMEPEEYSYKVNISINPQLTLYAGKNKEGEDIVLAWTFDNEDAEEVYKDTDFHDMSVLDAVKEVILVAAEKEYLKEDGAVEIDIVSDTEEIPEDIVKMYEEATNAVIKEKGLKGEVKVTRNGEEIKAEEEQEKEAAESKESDKTSTKETPAPSEDKKTASNTNTSTATPAPTQTQAPVVTPAPTATPVTTPAPAATPEPTQAPQEEQPAENNGDVVDAKGVVTHPDGSTGTGICSSKDPDGVDRNRCANPAWGEVYYDSITYYEVVDEDGDYKAVITYAHPTGGHVRCSNCGGSRDYMCEDWVESRQDYFWEDESVDYETYMPAWRAAYDEYQDPADESQIDPNTTFDERAVQYADSKVRIEDYTIEGHWVLVN